MKGQGLISGIRARWRDCYAARALTQAENDFGKEIALNLESLYVMKQRGTRSPFSLFAWERLTSFPPRAVPAIIKDYVSAVTRYNAVVHQWQQYEAWYRRQVEHQSKETARTLHDKKDVVDGEFARLEEIILAAAGR